MNQNVENSAFKDIFSRLYQGDRSSTSRQALVLLLSIRSFVTITGAIGLIVYQGYSGAVVPFLPMLVIFVGIFASLIFGFWRQRKAQVISVNELMFHLLTDVLFLVAVLLTVGGASNPLISYLLVLLAVGATFLTPLHAYVFAIGCILAYSLFIVADLSTDYSDSNTMMSFQLHLVGMWAIFVVSAGLIAVFVTRMANTIRERELTLAQSRENEMRNEQLVAIGTLAAGTAHALGTPLTTMAVLLADLDALEAEEAGGVQMKADISLLRQQVLRCKNSLNQLTTYYNEAFDNRENYMPLEQFVSSIQDYITNIHPAESVAFAIDQETSAIQVPNNLAINHAVINIVENAIKAASTETRVALKLTDGDKDMLEISVQDDGPGVPSAVMEKMGEPFISTREDSMGIGIYLANATIQKNGGSIEMFNRKSGGAQTIIRLPLNFTGPADAAS